MRKVVGSGSGLPRVGSRWCHTLTHFLPLLLSFARSFFAPSHRKVPRTLFRIPRSFLFISRTPHGCTIPLSARDRPPFRAVGRVRTGPAETETPPKCAAHRGNRFYVSLMVCITQRPGQKWGVWKMYYIYFFEFFTPPRGATLCALIKFAISSLSSLPFAHFCAFLLSFCSFSPSGTWKSFDLGDFPPSDLQAGTPGRNPDLADQLFKILNCYHLGMGKRGHWSTQKFVSSSSTTRSREPLAPGGGGSHSRIRADPLTT